MTQELLYLSLDLVDDFFLYLETNNYSTPTIYNYKKDLSALDGYLTLKKTTIKDMTKRDVFEFKAYLASIDRKTATTGIEANFRLSPASINRCLSAIRAYIRFLIEQDFKLQIIPDQFKMVKKEKSHPHVAELEELIALIEAPSKLEKLEELALRNRAMLEVLFATGMRISELVSLDKQNINESGRILISGKGKKQRFVYLTPRSLTHLNNYLALRNDTSPALFTPTKGKTTFDKGKRISTRYVQSKIKEYREALKINLPITPHSLRHGFATYLAESGASPVAIQMLLGHESLNTTTRYVNASDKFAQSSHKQFHPLSADDDS